MDVAKAIAGCDLFVGNQSFAYSVAEALKKPRVLEVFYAKNNCQPHGPDGYTNINEDLIRRYVR